MTTSSLATVARSAAEDGVVSELPETTPAAGGDGKVRMGSAITPHFDASTVHADPTLSEDGENPRHNSAGETPSIGRGQLVGYARVSTGDQDVSRQVTELAAAGCVRVFRDEGVSGARMSRPGLEEALSYLRAGDTLVVNELSRLGRDTGGVLSLIRDLEGRQIALRILGLGLDTATPTGRLVVTVLAAVAQMERELTIERIRSGIAEARRQGRQGGRPPALSVEQRELAVRLVREGQPPARVAALLGCSERTVRRVMAGQ